MIIGKLDIAFLIKSLSELEKLKLLLFDEHQYHLFQKIPKPYLVDAKSNLVKRPKDDLSPHLVASIAELDGEHAKRKSLSTRQSLKLAHKKSIKKDDQHGLGFDPVYISSNTFWNKSQLTNQDEMDKFSKALENIRAKEEMGKLNPIDKRLMKILRLYSMDKDGAANKK